jgi:hypothetical protein
VDGGGFHRCIIRRRPCPSGESRTTIEWERQMAVNVHDGEVGKILVYLIGFTAFVIVALTWVPHWISPDSANITVETGNTARMIQ